MASYRGAPIRAITQKACREAAEFGLNFNDIARLLEESYDCFAGRRAGIEERCVRKGRKVIKIVIEMKTSKSGFEYWRVRHIGHV